MINKPKFIAGEIVALKKNLVAPGGTLIIRVTGNGQYHGTFAGVVLREVNNHPGREGLEWENWDCSAFVLVSELVAQVLALDCSATRLADELVSQAQA